jgi:hypothetical protein
MGQVQPEPLAALEEILFLRQSMHLAVVGVVVEQLIQPMGPTGDLEEAHAATWVAQLLALEQLGKGLMAGPPVGQGLVAEVGEVEQVQLAGIGLEGLEAQAGRALLAASQDHP